MLTRVKPFLRKIFEFFFPYYLFVTGKIRNVKKASSEGKVILSVFFHEYLTQLFYEKFDKWVLNKACPFVIIMGYINWGIGYKRSYIIIK